MIVKFGVAPGKVRWLRRLRQNYTQAAKVISKDQAGCISLFTQEFYNDTISKIN